MKKLVMCAAVCLAAVLAVNGMAAYSVSVASKRMVPIYSVDRQDNCVALSFDAAWGADKTRKIMDICDDYGVKATFFLVGFWVEKYPELVKEIHLRGFEIGTHSQTHPHMGKLTEEQCADELQASCKAIFDVTGQMPTLFRPPYGDYGNALMRVCSQLGLHVVQWSVDSLDWQGLSAEQIACRVQKAQSGDIILCHNNSDHITEALPLMLEWGKIKGLNFRPVGEVIYTDNYTVDGSGKQTQNKQ
ncbi:MAG TPA: polysaccharide deacetylase family protein [Candidatus Fimimonas merdipullorum]|uniref:Polysaccharide deacetylase family protein n=1 Tax=Candidatus Fimimonas merdipullorum TaxID=2840822 RepID=A0A9D1MWT3_9BACT|nr:polysaccharide deacetylase family protein [Candidatus Fimimonas merdipullorum]